VRAGWAAPLVVLGLALTGCSTTLQDLPLPGTGVSGDTITITADFKEALNLAQGATVKVNGVNSGKVQEISVDDFQARAEMLVRTDAELHEGATARLRYTTPLGELFVDVTNPDTGSTLEDGAHLTTASTSTAPTVEDALSQASLLVNGGGLAQLQTVTDELNAALGGREDTVRSLLDHATVFLTEANATTADIDRTLRALSAVSVTLDDRQDTINRALREIRPAARVLRQNTRGLTDLLAEVETFSATANSAVENTRSQLLSIVRQVGPVLAELARNRSSFGPSLDQLVVLGDTIGGVVPGDYLSIALDLHFDQRALPGAPRAGLESLLRGAP
jgi:phospholipid/cholesterol/gamma-HCH transport system substrate-binding protein